VLRWSQQHNSDSKGWVGTPRLASIGGPVESELEAQLSLYSRAGLTRATDGHTRLADAPPPLTRADEVIE
jgi:hypothetical protein